MMPDLTGLRVELCACTATLLSEIACQGCKRNDVATTYALAILSSEATDWKAVGAAIIARWSRSALGYIKKRAWKLVEEKRRKP